MSGGSVHLGGGWVYSRERQSPGDRKTGELPESSLHRGVRLPASPRGHSAMRHLQNRPVGRTENLWPPK